MWDFLCNCCYIKWVSCKQEIIYFVKWGLFNAPAEIAVYLKDWDQILFCHECLFLRLQETLGLIAHMVLRCLESLKCEKQRSSWLMSLLREFRSSGRLQRQNSSNRAVFHCMSETLLSLPSPFSWHRLLPQGLECSSFPQDLLLFSSTETFKFAFRREDQSLILLHFGVLSALWRKWGRSLMTMPLFKA